jgi:hypothetical protein
MARRTLFDFEKTWDRAQKWFFLPLLGLILTLLLAWSIDSVRAWMQNHGLKDLDVPAVIGITLAATMFILLAFQQQLKQMGRLIGTFSPSASSKLLRGGIKDVYSELAKILADLGTGSSPERSLDVLGLTLFTAWPMLLEPSLGSTEGALRGWRVNVFFLCSDFIRANPCFSPTWALQSEAELSAIKEFAKNNALLLKQFGTELNVTQYRFFPAVHGFRTEAGHLLISYIHWSGDQLDAPTQFYEFFEPSDKSIRASLYRALFNNWIGRAKREATTGKVI